MAVAGEVDVTTADGFRECLLSQANLGHRTIVIDLSRLRFMDSTGLKALVDARRSVGTDGSIVLRAPTEMVRKLLDITGTAVLFEFA